MLASTTKMNLDQIQDADLSRVCPCRILLTCYQPINGTCAAPSRQTLQIRIIVCYRIGLVNFRASWIRIRKCRSRLRDVFFRFALTNKLALETLVLGFATYHINNLVGFGDVKYLADQSATTYSATVEPPFVLAPKSPCRFLSEILR